MIERVSLSRISGNVVDDVLWVQNALVEGGYWSRLSSAAMILVKPNLTYPFPKDGITTTPYLIDCVLRALLTLGKPIKLIESDGGSSTWSGSDSLRAHCDPTALHYKGLVELVNLSKAKTRATDILIEGKIVTMELPEILLDSQNVLLSLPAPKRHAMTGVSLGLKNQWGCIPDTKRLRYHHAFNEIIVELNKRWDPVCIVDGSFFLDESGPMQGRAIRKDLLMVGSVAGVSWACCEVMDVSFYSIAHHRAALKAGYFKAGFECVYVGEHPRSHRFKSTLKLSAMDLVAKLAFGNRLLTSVLYVSRWAKPIHDVVYLIKGRPKDIVPHW